MSYELVQTAENKPDKLSKFPLSAVTFVCSVNIYLLSSLLSIFFFLFQGKIASLKQALGHNHENTMFQLRGTLYFLYFER